MTSLGIQIAWSALQVTAVAMLALALLPWLARRDARSTVVVLWSAMMILLALTAMTYCPMPEFCRWSPYPSTGPENQSLPVATVFASPEQEAERDTDDRGNLSQDWAWIGNLDECVPQSSVLAHGWIILAAMYGLGVGIGVIRLLAGWLAVRALRRRSRLVTDPDLLQRTGDMQRALHCADQVELRHCGEPGLTATAGWRRPVIFLPAEWSSFTPAEQQAVLAHELAHVRNRDYLIGSLAHLCRVLHFYNPLIYWLSVQLRWQQEMAADALAAESTGGQECYVKSLARLALRTPARTPAGVMAWSGMSLLRRIDMLRERNKRRPLSGAIQGLIVGVLTVTAVLLCTLGTRAKPPEPTAVESAEAANEAKDCQVKVGIHVVRVSKQFFVRIHPDLKVDRPFKLNEIETFMLLEAVKGDRRVDLRQAPDILVSSGKWASLSWDTIVVGDKITARNSVSVKPLIAQDRRSLDLELNSTIGKVYVTKSAHLHTGHAAGFVADSSDDQVTFVLAQTWIVPDGKRPPDGKRAEAAD